jgi:hypothetical protein
MKGGALAVAEIRHRGLARFNEDFILTRGDGLPAWKDQAGRVVTLAAIERHIAVLLG